MLLNREEIRVSLFLQLLDSSWLQIWKVLKISIWGQVIWKCFWRGLFKQLNLVFVLIIVLDLHFGLLHLERFRSEICQMYLLTYFVDYCRAT